MEAKTYKGKTMLEALEQVQSELGPDAVVLSVREVPGPVWNMRKGICIEVKAAPPGARPKPKQPAPASNAAKTVPLPLVDDASKVEWVTDEAPAPLPRTLPPLPPAKQPVPVAAPVMKGKVAAAPAPAPVPAATPAELPQALLDLKQILLEQEVEAGFVSQVIQAAADTLSPAVLNSPEQCKKYVSQVMEARLRQLGAKFQFPPAPVIVLAGLSGCGKTTFAGRLAMTYGMRAGLKVSWICADVIRSGAIGEARIYTDALGLPLSVVYTSAELKEAVRAASTFDLTIVDLPGYNPLDEEQLAELGSLLAEIPNRCLLLVASASQKEKDLVQAAASFGVFGLDGLAVTKLDETATFGSIYNLAMKAGLPLAYFSLGKGADGSLAPATAEKLVWTILSKGGKA